jgi:hypothetical protein
LEKMRINLQKDLMTMEETEAIEVDAEETEGDEAEDFVVDAEETAVEEVLEEEHVAEIEDQEETSDLTGQVEEEVLVLKDVETVLKKSPTKAADATIGEAKSVCSL